MQILVLLLPLSSSRKKKNIFDKILWLQNHEELEGFVKVELPVDSVVMATQINPLTAAIFIFIWRGRDGESLSVSLSLKNTRTKLPHVNKGLSN